MTHAATWQEECTSIWSALDGNLEELTQRLDALEKRFPRLGEMTAAELASLPFRPIVAPLAGNLDVGTPQLCAACLVRHRPGENTCCPGFRAAQAEPICAQCNGPVEPERHCYAQPTCYRCLPPPEPLPVRAVDHHLALPDYLLAPAPDYRSELPAEPGDEACYECGTKHGPDENTLCPLSSVYAGPSISDPCGCDEAVELRKQLAELQSKLDSETASYDRTIKAEYSKREALEAECREMIGERDSALSRATKAEREVARLERAHRVTPGY